MSIDDIAATFVILVIGLPLLAIFVFGVVALPIKIVSVLLRPYRHEPQAARREYPWDP